MKKEIPGDKALTFKESEVNWTTIRFLNKGTSSGAKIIVYMFLTTFLAAFLYSYFSVIARSVEGTGSLKTISGIVKVNSQNSFLVDKVYVRAGDRIKKGQLIASSKNYMSHLKTQRLNKAIDDLKKQSEVLKQELDCKSCISEIIRVYKGVWNDLGSNPLVGELSQFKNSYDDLKLKSRQYKNREKVISALNLKLKSVNDKINRINNLGAGEYLDFDLERLKIQKGELEAQIEGKISSLTDQYKRSLNSFSTALVQVPLIIDKSQKDNSIISNTSGEVVRNTYRPGEVATYQENFVMVSPLNVQLEAIINIKNKDIGRIKNGMKVKVKVDAYPARDFGHIDARVTSISKISNSESNYIVRANLEKQYIEKDNLKHELKIDMSHSSLIITHYESLLRIGMKKIFKLKDQLFNE